MPRARIALLALAVACLAAGIAGGLARLGATLPAGDAVGLHAALMVSGFLGTVISIERAVALGLQAAYLAPAASGLGALAMLAGWSTAGAFALIVAPLALLAVSVAIVRRQRAAHTMLLAVAAAAWAVGNALLVAGRAAASIPWCFSFLVLTIAAERLELTRLAPHAAASRPLFVACVVALLAAAVLGSADERAGVIGFGVALGMTCAWLIAFDVARRRLRAPGLARYAAVALLGGYAWLAVAAAAWVAMAFDPGWRDAALHALGLGFVVSMILAHAPIVVPAVTRLRLRFTPLFYVPLAILHLSLAVRLAAGAHDASSRLAGAVGNVAAFVTLGVVMVWALRPAARQAQASEAA